MEKTAKNIMFLGTGSDVGKSVTAAAFCRILKRRGVDVAPFKAQNMSNNSYITAEGGEIGRAQVVQAEAAGLAPSSHMNPVLLKPSSHLGSQVVVQGKVWGQMEAAEYHRFKPRLQSAVMASYHHLAARHDVIVMEGAGSCGEVNLKSGDLVNLAMARRADAPCILVADIDRGGVFAQIVGSMALMTRSEKARIRGFVINKFRGDPALFSDGIRFLEKRTGRPVLGLVPFFDHIRIDPEDSVAVQADKRRVRPLDEKHLGVAVIKLPGLSNFTDLEALEREPEVIVNYLERAQDLAGYDLLILPGTKNTMEDAAWLGRTGWTRRVRDFHRAGGRIVGLCGGYQLLGVEIHDPLGVESDRERVRGLGLAPLKTTMAGDKVLRTVTGRVIADGRRIEGYEIHMGETVTLPGAESPKPFLRLRQNGARDTWEDGIVLNDGRVLGTYMHGLLDAPGFRGALLNGIRRDRGLPERRRPAPGRSDRYRQYDLLADHYERYCDIGRVLGIIGI